MILSKFLKSGAHVGGERDFGAGFLINSDVNSVACTNDLFLFVPQYIGKSKRSVPDVGELDFNRDAISNKKRGFEIRFSMHDRQKIILLQNQNREPESPRFEKRFVGVVHQFELIAEKKQAGGVGFVKFDGCFIDEHESLSQVRHEMSIT